MSEYYQSFINHLKKKNIKFDIQEDNKLIHIYILDKLKTGSEVGINYFFPKKNYRDGLDQLVDIIISGGVNFPEDKKNIALYKYINDLNKRLSIIKFYINEKHNEISVSITIPYNNNDFDNDYLINMTGRALNSIEKEYSNFMNIIWS